MSFNGRDTGRDAMYHERHIRDKRCKHGLKNDIKKAKEDGHYVALSEDSVIQAGPVARVDSDEFGADSDTTSPHKKNSFINKLFKPKLKNNSDEASSGSGYNQLNISENEAEAKSTPESVVRPNLKSVFNRKRKSTPFFQPTAQQKKYPTWAKVKQVQDKPRKYRITKPYKRGGEETDTTSLEPLISLIENNEEILAEFDPLWCDKKKISDTIEADDLEEKTNIRANPTRNTVIDEKLMLGEKISNLNITELKVATLESIQENDCSEEEQAIDEVINEYKLAKAKVTYEGLDGVFARPIQDYSEAIKEEVFATSVPPRNILGAIPQDLASASYAELEPVFHQHREDPWNILFGDYQVAKGSKPQENSGAFWSCLANMQDMKQEPGAKSGLELLPFQPMDEQERANNKVIADFFAEKDRSLDEDDIANYSNNIEISKIEIYEEDIKRYHQRLLYHRGPVEHDIIFTTVETALKFVEKLDKERQQKKKSGFLPDVLEKCLKSKAKREKEKEEEERKKKEKQANKKKGPRKPKMWLVYNKLGKEKVIICTTPDFYDSD